MRKRTILIVISTCLLIPVISILVITFTIMTEGSMPTDDEIASLSDKLIDDSMIILKKYPVGAYSINEEEWPESIKALSPLSLSADSEGLYIKTKKRFVDVWGVFIPREDSKKYLEKITMPTTIESLKVFTNFMPASTLAANQSLQGTPIRTGRP